jgi:SAM-dependent methyltransferase
VGGGGRGAVADLGDRGPDGAGDVEPGAFGFRAEAPGPAAEPGRGGELADQEVLLGAQAAGPLGVVPRLSFGEFLVEGGEALPVGRPGLLVEDLVGPGSRRAVQPVFPPSVEQARRAVAEAGLAGRASYQVLDAAAGLPDSFDVITTFDVVHDAVDPLGLLRSIRDALRPGGSYLCLEINCSDQAAANTGPIATLLYGFSVLYCMTTSLAEGGEGLGTLGLPEPVLRDLAAKAGFAQVRHVEMDNPFNSLYELTR